MAVLSPDAARFIRTASLLARAFRPARRIGVRFAAEASKLCEANKVCMAVDPLSECDWIVSVLELGLCDSGHSPVQFFARGYQHAAGMAPLRSGTDRQIKPNFVPA